MQRLRAPDRYAKPPPRGTQEGRDRRCSYVRQQGLYFANVNLFREPTWQSLPLRTRGAMPLLCLTSKGFSLRCVSRLPPGSLCRGYDLLPLKDRDTRRAVLPVGGDRRATDPAKGPDLRRSRHWWHLRRLLSLPEIPPGQPGSRERHSRWTGSRQGVSYPLCKRSHSTTPHRRGV
jgi:hypothetical protein